MNLLGAMGNVSLAIVATDRALKEFYQARSLALELEDLKSEIGFTGNIGTLFSFQGNHRRAVEEFEKILAYVEKQDDLEAHIQTLRHLCQSYSKLKNYEQVLEYAQQGVQVADRKDKDTSIFFYEKLITSYYQMSNLEKAQKATQEAILIASTMKDKTKEMELLIGLGESFTLSEMYSQALEVYEKARVGATRLQQLKNDAYLVGRIGVVLAEMGELDRAIAHHQEAVSLAQERGIKDLEGQQLSMLAMAYLDEGEIERALDFANQSLEVFLGADLIEESEKARQLLSQIKALKKG
jgi:tetratricopeptide (TPR) repeat protein